jgi:hypothetical protein
MKLPLPLEEGWGEGYGKKHPLSFRRALTLALSPQERGYLSLLAMTILLTSCGHVTPLVEPKDIPAYEQKRKEKLEKYEPYRDKDTSWYE